MTILPVFAVVVIVVGPLLAFLSALLNEKPPKSDEAVVTVTVKCKQINYSTNSFFHPSGDNLPVDDCCVTTGELNENVVLTGSD